MATVLRTSPRRFVSTEAIDRLTKRTLRYLNSGYSVHLRGPAGTGKTTLALHLADLLQRPMMLMFGDDEAKTSDLIGKQSGYTRKKIVDNYIHSVVKVEDQLRQTWVDSRLTLACREGYTLIYDEFNRSRPEVNNVLLSVLEEKILVLPPESNRVEYLKVSPQFRAIFTSNPEEYCGVHATQDALMDRLITIDVPEPDDHTQQEILLQKSELDRASVATIVQVVKAFRVHTQSSASSGLRSCLMISKICKDHDIVVDVYNAEFRDLCADILLSRSSQSIEESVELLWQVLQDEPPAWAKPIDPVQTVLQDLIPVTIAPVLPLENPAVAEEAESSELSEQIAALEFDPSIGTMEPDPVLDLNLELAVATAPEETVAKLDDDAWKVVLETSRPIEEPTPEASTLELTLESTPIGSDNTESMDSTLSDLFDDTIDRSLLKYVDLSPEGSIGGSSSPRLAVAVAVAEPVVLPDVDAWAELAEAELAKDLAPMETSIESPMETSMGSSIEMSIAMLIETPIETPIEIPIETPIETPIEPKVETKVEPMVGTVLTVEEQLFRYLLGCEQGARLAQIELDLQLPRSQAVDAIRELAKSNRLAQRDRHFFALK